MRIVFNAYLHNAYIVCIAERRFRPNVGYLRQIIRILVVTPSGRFSLQILKHSNFYSTNPLLDRSLEKNLKKWNKSTILKKLSFLLKELHEKNNM